MGLSIVYMRKEIASVYDSWKWRDRVAAMGTRQVAAIYYSFLEHGKFSKPKKQKGEPEYVQMTIWDFINEDKEIII